MSMCDRFDCHDCITRKVNNKLDPQLKDTKQCTCRKSILSNDIEPIGQ